MATSVARVVVAKDVRWFSVNPHWCCVLYRGQLPVFRVYSVCMSRTNTGVTTVRCTVPSHYARAADVTFLVPGCVWVFPFTRNPKIDMCVTVLTPLCLRADVF